MASEIQIRGPLKFIGYVQTNRAGTNGQLLTYRNGEADWADPDVDSVVTSTRNSSPAIDTKGNLITADEGTYDGIDTRPPEAEDRGSVISVNDVEVEDPNFVDGDNTTLVVTGNDVAINVPDATGGHVIQDTAGTSFPQRANLRFLGTDFEIRDDSANDATVVDLVDLFQVILVANATADTNILHLGSDVVGITPELVSSVNIPQSEIVRVGDDLVWSNTVIVDTQSVHTVYKMNILTQVITEIGSVTKGSGDPGFSFGVNRNDIDDIWYMGEAEVRSFKSTGNYIGDCDSISSTTCFFAGSKPQRLGDTVYFYFSTAGSSGTLLDGLYGISATASTFPPAGLVKSESEFITDLQTAGLPVGIDTQIEIVGTVDDERIFFDIRVVDSSFTRSHYWCIYNVITDTIEGPYLLSSEPYTAGFPNDPLWYVDYKNGSFYWAGKTENTPATDEPIHKLNLSDQISTEIYNNPDQNAGMTAGQYNFFAITDDDTLIYGNGNFDVSGANLYRQSITGSPVAGGRILRGCFAFQNESVEVNPPISYNPTTGIATAIRGLGAKVETDFSYTVTGTYEGTGNLTASILVTSGGIETLFGTKVLQTSVGTHSDSITIEDVFNAGDEICVFFAIEDTANQTTDFDVSGDDGSTFTISGNVNVEALGDLSDVINTVTTDAVEGDLLTFDSGSGLWENKQPEIKAVSTLFNNSTDWTQVGTTDVYTIDFVHNLNSDLIFWEVYDSVNTGVQLQTTKESNARLRITLNDNERFAGRIYIERI